MIDEDWEDELEDWDEDDWGEWDDPRFDPERDYQWEDDCRGYEKFCDDDCEELCECLEISDPESCDDYRCCGEWCDCPTDE